MSFIANVLAAGVCTVLAAAIALLIAGACHEAARCRCDATEAWNRRERQETGGGSWTW